VSSELLLRNQPGLVYALMWRPIMHRGYIKLYRKIRETSIWQEKTVFTKREAWIDMLLSARYEDGTVVLGMEAFEVKAGQMIKSQRTWANDWRWSESKVRNFFKLLRETKQITTKNLGNTTQVTICNWELYNERERTDDAPATHPLRTDDAPAVTKKKVKKDNKVKKRESNLEIPPEIRESFTEERWTRVIEIWNRRADMHSYDPIEDLTLEQREVFMFAFSRNEKFWPELMSTLGDIKKGTRAYFTFDWVFQTVERLERAAKGGFSNAPKYVTYKGEVREDGQ